MTMYLLHTCIHCCFFDYVFYFHMEEAVLVKVQSAFNGSLTNYQSMVHSTARVYVWVSFVILNAAYNRTMHQTKQHYFLSASLVNSFILLAPLLCLESKAMLIRQQAVVVSQPGLLWLLGHKETNPLYIIQVQAHYSSSRFSCSYSYSESTNWVEVLKELVVTAERI